MSYDPEIINKSYITMAQEMQLELALDKALEALISAASTAYVRERNLLPLVIEAVGDCSAVVLNKFRHAASYESFIAAHPDTFPLSDSNIMAADFVADKISAELAYNMFKTAVDFTVITVLEEALIDELISEEPYNAKSWEFWWDTGRNKWLNATSNELADALNSGEFAVFLDEHFPEWQTTAE